MRDEILDLAVVACVAVVCINLFDATTDDAAFLDAGDVMWKVKDRRIVVLVADLCSETSTEQAEKSAVKTI